MQFVREGRLDEPPRGFYTQDDNPLSLATLTGAGRSDLAELVSSRGGSYAVALALGLPMRVRMPDAPPPRRAVPRLNREVTTGKLKMGSKLDAELQRAESLDVEETRARAAEQRRAEKEKLANRERERYEALLDMQRAFSEADAPGARAAAPPAAATPGSDSATSVEAAAGGGGQGGLRLTRQERLYAAAVCLLVSLSAGRATADGLSSGVIPEAVADGVRYVTSLAVGSGLVSAVVCGVRAGEHGRPRVRWAVKGLLAGPAAVAGLRAEVEASSSPRER